MEMRRLRAFLAVADTLHFGRAAARLHVAQPAISAAIRELEEELQVVLFDRTRRHVELSVAGVQLRPAVEDALATLERGAVDARRAAKGETGRVVLQFTAMAAMSPLPQALARFRRSHPDVRVVIEQRGTLDQVEALRAGRCDLAFTVMPGEVDGLATASLTSEPLVAMLPAGHPGAGAAGVAFSTVAAEPMLLLPRRTDPALHEAYRRLCAAAGVEPNVGLEVDQLDAVLAFVAAGLGCTLLPMSVTRLRFDGVSAVPLVPTVWTGVTVVWDASRLSPAAAALLAEVMDGGGPPR
jgi:DNA-binding transcriptional LysR family regulator